jgi:hypothetical protein
VAVHREEIYDRNRSPRRSRLRVVSHRH